MRRNQFTYSSRDLMQLIVFSLVVVLGPLLFYPHTLGAEFSLSLSALLLFEGVYYLTVFTIVNSGAGLMASLLGAVIAMTYRFALAALFGLMIFAPGAELWSLAFAQGVNGYWPAFGLFVLCSPFVTMSLVKWCVDRLDSQDASTSVSPSRPEMSSDASMGPMNAPVQPYFSHGSTSGSEPNLSTQIAAPKSAFEVGADHTDGDASEFAFGADTEREQHDRTNGFERGVRYLAEHAAVRVAAIVDSDGFQLAGFGRLGFAAEAWAPMALTIIENNSETLARFGAARPGRVELDYDNLRIDCRSVGMFYLLVVSERHADDLLGVRVSQACEMINKYVSVRYSEKVMNSLTAKMEEQDVRSA